MCDFCAKMPRMNHESKKSVFMGYRGVPWPKYDVKPSMETLNYNRRSYYTDAGAPKQSTERFNYDRRMDYAGTSSGSRYEYTPHNSFIQPPVWPTHYSVIQTFLNKLPFIFMTHDLSIFFFVASSLQ